MRHSPALLIAGGLLLAVGLYVVGFAIHLDLSHEGNLASCTTPLCGAPPPPVWSFLWFAGPFVFFGALVLIFGMVELRRERGGRIRLGGVQQQTST